MRDYTKIEAWRLADDLTVSIYERTRAFLGYLTDQESRKLHEQTKVAFACLHGLIRAVEKEAGKMRKLVAATTSLIAIALMHWSRSQWSVVS